MSDNKVDRKDEFQECPICRTVPPGHIFQCKNGHVVCKKCLQKIQKTARDAEMAPKCPFCARPLDKEGISRCLVLENILDTLVFGCSHKAAGCPEKLKRGNIRDHEKSCLYGRSFNICRFMHEYCDYALSAGNAKTFMEHLHRHGDPYEDHDKWIMNLKPGWGKAVARDAFREYGVFMQLPEGKCPILIFVVVTKDLVSISAMDFALSIDPTDKVQLTFSVPDEESPSLSWSFDVKPGIKSWEYLNACKEYYRYRRSPLPGQFQMSIHSLLPFCDEDGDILMSIRMKLFNE